MKPISIVTLSGTVMAGQYRADHVSQEKAIVSSDLPI